MVAALLAAPPVLAATKPRVYDLIAGGEHEYTVARGRQPLGITGRFTMNRALLEAWNGLENPDVLRPGMRLRVSDRHIVPRRQSDGIVIDVAVRTLYWFEHGALKARYPARGRADRLGDAAGRYRIVGRREDPPWRVPESIQNEMRAHGEEVVRYVPPGADKPARQVLDPALGARLRPPRTNAPASIGKYASHGCMRLLPEHVERLYHEARDGTPVDIVYEPVKLARDAVGSFYVEVHTDVLGGRRHDLSAVIDFIESAGLTEAVDVTKVAQAVARAWGIPEDVTLHPLPAGGPDEIGTAEVVPTAGR
jgi:L,D-transpeptidase ErfK/SrfK